MTKSSVTINILLVLGLLLSIGGDIYILIYGKGALIPLVGLILGAIVYKKSGNKVFAAIAMVVGLLGVLWAILQPVFS